MTQEKEDLQMQGKIADLENSNRALMEEYQQYRNEMTERNQEMNEVCQVKQRQLENMSQELQYYREEREKTDRQIVEATNFIRTSATRARTMSKNLARLKEKVVIMDTPEANLSAYLDGIIGEMGDYGRFT
ncbi:hypothetical protein M5689_000784 [Euphorbia peplus]|nr:hypothetical protein M5689_000784 [Euphorbia peplus]